MKKILLFASAVLALASCSQDELDSFNVDNNVKGQGITFAVENDPETKAQWDYVDGGLGMFWYAEADQMDFYGKNVTITKSGTTENLANEWGKKIVDITASPITTTAATAYSLPYKATRSLGAGYFTSTNADVFKPMKIAKKWQAPTFAYVWPSGTTVKAVNNKSTKLDELVLTLPAIDKQKQTTVKGSEIVANSPMTGIMTVPTTQLADYTSGSDMLINIKLKRAMPLLGIYMDGINDDFGNLKEVLLESLGEIKDDKKVDPSKKSVLDFGTASTWNIETEEFTQGAVATTPNQIKLTIGSGSGLKWGNGRDFTAFMTVAPVDRSKMKNGERLQVTYTFENIVIKRTIDVTQSWLTGHHYYASVLSGVKGYDFSALPYLVFDNGTSIKTLQINPSFNKRIYDIVDNTGNIVGFEKTAANTIKKVVANVDLTENDLGQLNNKFGAIEQLTLKENASIMVFDKLANIKNVYLPKLTTIPVGAFAKAATNLTKVNLGKVTALAANTFEKNTSLSEVVMPELTELVANAFAKNAALTKVTLNNVTKVDKTAFAAAVALTDVIMPKFDFAASKAVTETILKAANLVTLDMSGVASMKATFPNEGFALTNFANLKTVTVKEGLEVGTSSFEGCKLLTGLNTYVVLAGTAAFQGSGLKTIKVKGTEIPANTFNGCKALTTVTDAVTNKDLIPTRINLGAFDGATSFANMDLSATTFIGENAFNGATSFVGMHNKAKNIDVVYVGAAEVGANAFNTTGIKYIEFTNLKKLVDGVLAGTTPLEIKFKEVLEKPAATVAKTALGTVSGATLFLNQNQPTSFYEGKNFYPNGVNTGKVADQMEFAKIVLE